jgi:hypothetical protein
MSHSFYHRKSESRDIMDAFARSRVKNYPGDHRYVPSAGKVDLCLSLEPPAFKSPFADFNRYSAFNNVWQSIRLARRQILDISWKPNNTALQNPPHELSWPAAPAASPSARNRFHLIITALNLTMHKSIRHSSTTILNRGCFSSI